MATSLGQRSSRVIGGVLKGKAGQAARGVLDTLGIGGVSLGSLLPIGENVGWDADPLLESAYNVRIGNFPDLERGDLLTVDINLPQIQYRSKLEVGLQAYYPDKVQVPDLTLALNETSYGKVFGYYRTVQKAIFDEESGTYGIPVDYQTDIDVDILYYDGRPVFTVTHKNCSLASISKYGMSNVGAKAITPTVTFKVERIEIKEIDPEILEGGILDEIMRTARDILGISIKDKINTVMRGF